MTFAWCPPGTFLMGSPASEKKRQVDETQHSVTLTKGFFAGIHPVTQAQYQAVMGSNPSHFRGDTRPVEKVSWEDSQEFCKKLRELTGKPIRLPTEAEWEYACRAGEGGDYWIGTGEEALKQVAWYSANSNGQTEPVGQKKPNKWGLFDVHGNVWEWCEDWYNEKYYGRGPATDPICRDGEQKFRVLRGGSWCYNPGYCRAARRTWAAPAYRDLNYGFRVVFCLD